METMKSLYPETADDALAEWDSGGSVFSVSLGGIGPGYEMRIQGLMFEMIRSEKGIAWPPIGDPLTDEFRDEFIKRADAVVERCDSLPWGGFSGAQVGQARNMVAIVKRRGYRNAIEMESVKDRLIQVSRCDLRGSGAGR